LAGLGVVLAACSGSTGSTTTSAPDATTVTTTTATTTTATTTTVPDDASVELLAAFPRAEIDVASEPWQVAVADTPQLRAQGLMGVTDLGDVDGMLFVWDSDTPSWFWMKDTLIPLDIAFFRADGSPVAVLSMVPCEADPCPSYGPAGGRAYRYALEAPAGQLVGMEEDGLELGGIPLD
jgi:uncharacterized membrane protein (UPF0127 family)